MEGGTDALLQPLLFGRLNEDDRLCWFIGVNIPTSLGARVILVKPY